jgi:ADP-ribose pyrophosphatase YjhB (NUDIX family)
MTESNVPRWLAWAREIQALSQTGLTYSTNAYDTQRYQRLMAIAAAMVVSSTGPSEEAWLQDFLAQPGYATPTVDVRAAIVREGNLLLVQERADHHGSLPGGWADVGERPSAMVVREVVEESGFDVVVRKLIGVYDANRGPTPLQFYHAYKLVFLCDIVGGRARSSDETLAVDFFRFDDLPPLSAARTNERHLADVLATVRDPDRPTVVD